MLWRGSMVAAYIDYTSKNHNTAKTSWLSNHKGQLVVNIGCKVLAYLITTVLLLLIHTFSVLSLQLKKLRWHNKSSAIDLSNVNPACGHKEVRRSTGHIMVTTRYYSDQQGSKSRQKVMRPYKQWHRPISKRFIKPPYSILSRATSIDLNCCRLPTISVPSNKLDKLRSN